MNMYFRSVVTGAMLGVCALGVTACEEEPCTGIGCADPVMVHVTAAAWLTGEYTVGVTTPERAFTCSLSVPVLDSEGSAGAAGQAGVWSLPVECTQTAWLAAEQWEFPIIDFYHGFYIYLRWAPSEVELTLHYEGQELLEESLTPTYTKSYPNGPECDADPCLNYQATLEARSPTAT